MLGRVSVLVVVGLVGAALPAAAQAPTQRPDPAAVLLPPLPPVARGSTPTDDRPPPKSRTTEADRPAPAARFVFPKDLTPVSGEAVAAATGDRTAARPPARGDELFDYLSVVRRPDDRPPARQAEDPPAEGGLWSAARGFGHRIRHAIDDDLGHGWFQSDRAFDCVVSPITNPFLFEDPRAVTELRPIFIYQKIRDEQPNFQGGNLWFLGAQTRLAFGERFSLTINKLGGIAVDGNNPAFGSEFGLAELWLGPKVTLVRNPESATLVAAGAIFQLPVGSGNVFQDTGDLSIAPYLTASQRFWASRFGTFNGMVNTGYSFSTDDERSDYYWLSTHLSFDVGDAHRFYPLVEMNWFQYTNDGRARPYIKGEGRDLVNFGSQADGSSLLTGAVGARFKMTRNTEIGAAFELPIAGNRDFFEYRFTVDFIWRY